MIRITQRTKDGAMRIKEAIDSGKRVLAHSGSNWFVARGFRVDRDGAYDYWYALLPTHRGGDAWFNVNTFQVPTDERG